ncbi:MAG: NAD-dependent epimerase/dehydratase family protein, partial [Rhodospirillales bacterium]
MIVVTGGAGFIGSNIVAALEDRGDCEIVVCDLFEDSEKKLNISKRNLAHFFDANQLFKFLDGHQGQIEAIVHMAAISSTTTTDVDLILDSNVRLPLQLWQ